ncbi:modifier of mdg4-like isoform X6 [Lucilia sericata]|uniref:modifier of mdg4-like isoform X6 n=1 Tax=Lucilia sericata TaxID=13632 RepID=UPI0018A82786|nr:modifier of mdg4-like isoform X6 [Lucilia sericata]
MADDEQFSLCWNNFNSNLSAGFHESLCRGDLVDVTLAAEGQFVKAHRLVLSVCSPYFRKMFTQMPANQHAFVFLKDVSHTALKDLIQFMYCGEVNVKQEALPAFISTAEALQIKGLTDSDPPQSQTPPEPSTPTPQIQQQQQIQTSPRVRQRTSTARSYKIETVEDSGDDAKQTTQIVIQTTAPTHPPQATITTQPQHQQQHQPQQQQQQHHHQPQQQQHITQQTLHTQTHQLTSVSMPAATTTTVVTQKRPAQRSSLGSVPNIKRSKSTIDPLEASDANTAAATHQINVQTVVAESKPQVQHHHQQQQQHQTHHHHQQQQAQHQQQTNEPEYIDLPIDLPTKSEPDYAEEAGEVDQAEQDATYVEDESYGDMRYDESYFTENEDAAAAGGNATATSTQNTSATTATTSKAIVKQQPLSDSSYMDTSADPANSDAQDTIRTFQYSVANIKLEVTEENETFLHNSYLKCNNVALKRGSGGGASLIKTGLSKRKPTFLNSRTLDDWGNIKYTDTARGNKLLYFEGHRFIKNNIYGSNIYWKCSKWHSNCKARAITSLEVPSKCIIKGCHNHPLTNED